VALEPGKVIGDLRTQGSAFFDIHKKTANKNHKEHKEHKGRKTVNAPGV
jgi:hypothetical protein